MQDLNDIGYFTAVVEHKGFSAAARALGLPKSTLSRHVGRLEKRLGVRLLERSTRHFRLTDVGERYYAKAREILAELTAADKELAEMRSAPCGVVRLAAPLAAAQYVLPLILPSFMARHPLIKLQVIVSDRPVDLVADKIDIAIRARTALGNEALTTVQTEANEILLLFGANIGQPGENLFPGTQRRDIPYEVAAGQLECRLNFTRPHHIDTFDRGQRLQAQGIHSFMQQFLDFARDIADIGCPRAVANEHL